MSNTKHTPTPWMTDGKYIENGNETVAVCTASPLGFDMKREDADHIVKCVNMHDELVEALKSWVDAMDNDRSTSDSYLTALETLNKAGAL